MVVVVKSFSPTLFLCFCQCVLNHNFLVKTVFCQSSLFLLRKKNHPIFVKIVLFFIFLCFWVAAATGAAMQKLKWQLFNANVSTIYPFVTFTIKLLKVHAGSNEIYFKMLPGSWFIWLCWKWCWGSEDENAWSCIRDRTIFVSTHRAPDYDQLLHLIVTLFVSKLNTECHHHEQN